MVMSLLSNVLSELSRSLLNMIWLQVEDMPSMEAVGGPILALLILRDPRSVLRLPPPALLPQRFSCLPSFPLLMVVAEVPVVLPVEAVVTLAIDFCLAPLPAGFKVVRLSRFHARSRKGNAGDDGQGKQEQLHGRTESLRETIISQEGFNPFI